MDDNIVLSSYVLACLGGLCLITFFLTIIRFAMVLTGETFIFPLKYYARIMLVGALLCFIFAIVAIIVHAAIKRKDDDDKSGPVPLAITACIFSAVAFVIHLGIGIPAHRYAQKHKDRLKLIEMDPEDAKRKVENAKRVWGD